MNARPRVPGAALAVAMVVLLAAACRDSREPAVGTTATATPHAVAPSVARDEGRPDPSTLTRCTVRFVHDGDTLDVTGCADAGRVRLILIDAPEVGEGCFATPATARLRALLPPGSEVGLERDVSNVDTFGRLLRYAWTDDDLVNRRMVEEGFATLAVFPPDVRYRDLIERAEDEARERGLGLWGECRPVPTLPAGGTCDPAYPTVCLPSPPPDLDCGDIPFRRFTVLPPDPHHFDVDGDGVGCEGG